MFERWSRGVIEAHHFSIYVTHDSSCAMLLTPFRKGALLADRQRLDRRRVEDAFFQYAMLRAASWYPHSFSLCTLPCHKDTTDTLAKFTAVYHGAFMNKYASA